jgi:MYXO-CTERM domain-containing protein
MSKRRSSTLIAIACVLGPGSAEATPIQAATRKAAVTPPAPTPFGAGGCPTGYYPCGDDYCTPDGAVCCDSVGHPEGYCPAGTTCTPDGQCDSGGGGSCDAGYYSCGADYCTPDGAVCCDGAGHPEIYCPAGSTCTFDGQCDDGSGDGGFTCGDIADGGGCSIQFCVEVESCQGYYVVDGVQFDCVSCDDLAACAEDAADFCVGGDGGDAGDQGGCRVASGQGGLPLALALGALVALGAARRRRSDRARGDIK